MFLFQISTTAPKPEKQQEIQPKQKEQPFFTNTPYQPSIPYEKFTPEMKQMLKAVEYSGEKLWQYTYLRSADFDGGRGYFGPNFDTCFFYWFSSADDQRAYTLAGLIEDEHSTTVKQNIPLAVRDYRFLKDESNFSKLKDAAKKSGETIFGGVAISNADNTKQIISKRAEILLKFENPANSPKMVSDSELNVTFLLGFNARQEWTGKKRMYFCVKHFPPVGNELDATHMEKIISHLSLKDLTHLCAPYSAAMNYAHNPLQAVMVNLCVYPEAESELREKYSFPTLFPQDVPFPAAFSPYIVRGLLHGDLGFQGVISTDALGMEAIPIFIKENRKKLPKKLQNYTDAALTFISCVYAGVNWPLTGLNEKSMSQVRKYYDSNPEFKAMLHDVALESVFKQAKLLQSIGVPTGIDLSGISLPDIKNWQLLPEGKRKAIETLDSMFTGEKGFEAMCSMVDAVKWSNEKDNLATHPDASELQKSIKAWFSRDAGENPHKTEDIWNRGGIMDFFFRANIVANLSSKNDFIDLNGHNWGKAGMLDARFSLKIAGTAPGAPLLTNIAKSGYTLDFNRISLYLADGTNIVLTRKESEQFNSGMPVVKGEYLIFFGSDKGKNFAYSAKLGDTTKATDSLNKAFADANKSNGTSYRIALVEEDLLNAAARKSCDVSASFYIISSPAELGKLNLAIDAFVPFPMARQPPKISASDFTKLQQEGASILLDGFKFIRKGGEILVKDEKPIGTIRLRCNEDRTKFTIAREIEENEWLDTFFSNKQFADAYNKINWNSPEMEAVFDEYFRRLAAGYYTFEPKKENLRYIAKADAVKMPVILNNRIMAAQPVAPFSTDYKKAQKQKKGGSD